MNKKLRTEAVDFLFDAVLSLKDREECYTFLKMYARSMRSYHCPSGLRWLRCSGNRRPIWKLQRRLVLPPATISRVNRSLNYGNDGYDMVFQRLEAEKGQE